MDLADVREKVKQRLDIASTDIDFDEIVEDCIVDAIRRLSPFAQCDLAPDESITVSAGADSFTIAAPTMVTDLFEKPEGADTWRRVDLWKQYMTQVILFETTAYARNFKVLAHRPYEATDGDITIIESTHPSLFLAIYLFAQAEFANHIIGNKRKFNMYQQSNGTRTLSEMQELVEHYERRAIRLLEDDLSAEGQ